MGDRAVNRRREHDAGLGLEPDERLAPDGSLRGDIGAHDRHQPAAGAEAGQRRSKVLERGIGHAARNVSER